MKTANIETINEGIFMKNIKRIFTYLIGLTLLLSSCTTNNNSNNGGNSGGNNNNQNQTEYTTRFETNGGTAVSPLKGTITYAPTTTKDGFDFVAWCKDSSLYQAVSFPFTPTSDTTLYAKWSEKNYEVQTVALSKTKGYVYPGINLSLSATITPSNATNKNLTWSSTNQNVASVSSSGVVTYSGNGTTIIKATASNGVFGECTVKAGKHVTVTSSTSGYLTRDDGVSGYYSGLSWSASGTPSSDKQWGALSWNFTMYSSTASRGGLYIYVYDENHNMIIEKWYQLGMITPNQSFNCSCDLGIPLESFYTIEFGTNGRWFAY